MRRGLVQSLAPPAGSPLLDLEYMYKYVTEEEDIKMTIG